MGVYGCLWVRVLTFMGWGVGHGSVRALTVEPEVGLLLPCNVVVRVEGDATRVDIVDPEAMLGIAGQPGKPELYGVAGEAKQRLQRVVAALDSQGAQTTDGTH